MGYRNNNYSRRNSGANTARRTFQPVESDLEGLLTNLERMDGRNYGSYKSIIGKYQLDDWKTGALLLIDRIQSDPYAPPSQLRIQLSKTDLPVSTEQFSNPTARMAIADLYARKMQQAIKGIAKHPRDITIARPGQEILSRTSVMLAPHPDITNPQAALEIRFKLQFPARGRTILGKTAADLIEYDLLDIVEEAIYQTSTSEIKQYVETLEDYLAAQSQLGTHELVGFIADGSVLPRKTGISDLPLDKAVPTKAPESLAVTLDLPNRGKTRGLGIPQGLTLIVGGGFHGKSTLLRALERGIYPHVPGDGRELVVTEPSAQKLRAEDGRSIRSACISDLISDLPSQADTSCFSTDNASGSTSQAAAIAEALEAGTQTLLIDEDTSATNLMIRDQLMRELVKAEPITPLVDRVSDLVQQGKSLVIVMGGSSDYLADADHVIGLENYRLSDVTESAQKIVANASSAKQPDRKTHNLDMLHTRRGLPQKIRTGDRTKLRVHQTESFSIDKEETDLRAVEQIVDSAQTNAIARIVLSILTHSYDLDEVPDTLTELIETLIEEIRNRGWHVLGTQNPLSGELARVRVQEVSAALNRTRNIRFPANN